MRNFCNGYEEQKNIDTDARTDMVGKDLLSTAATPTSKLQRIWKNGNNELSDLKAPRTEELLLTIPNLEGAKNETSQLLLVCQKEVAKEAEFHINDSDLLLQLDMPRKLFIPVRGVFHTNQLNFSNILYDPPMQIRQKISCQLNYAASHCIAVTVAAPNDVMNIRTPWIHVRSSSILDLKKYHKQLENPMNLYKIT